MKLIFKFNFHRNGDSYGEREIRIKEILFRIFDSLFFVLGIAPFRFASLIPARPV